MTRKFVVDRFEGEFAVIVDDEGTTKNIDRINVSSSLKEGDVCLLFNGFYHVDNDESHKKKEEFQKLFDKAVGKKNQDNVRYLKNQDFEKKM